MRDVGIEPLLPDCYRCTYDKQPVVLCTGFTVLYVPMRNEAIATRCLACQRSCGGT